MATIVESDPSARPETRENDGDASSISSSSYMGSDSPDRDPTTRQRETGGDGDQEQVGERSAEPISTTERVAGDTGNNLDADADTQDPPTEEPSTEEPPTEEPQAEEPHAVSQEIVTDALQAVPASSEALDINTTEETSSPVPDESASTRTAPPVLEDPGAVVHGALETGVVRGEGDSSLSTTPQVEEAAREPASRQPEAPQDTETHPTTQSAVSPQQDALVAAHAAAQPEGPSGQDATRARAGASPRPESRSLLDALDSSIPANSQRSSHRTSGTGRRGPVIVYGGYRSRPSARGSPQPPAQAVRSMLLPSQEPPLPARPPTPPPLPRDPVPTTSANQPRIEISSPEGEVDGDAAERSPSGTGVVLPRWQPDAEVTICPICRTQFGWLNRKHHCRKCGRVVCNSCSPHRITIPYQFIVQPPGTPQRSPSTLPVDSPGGYTDFNSLGGGERVRLCNPCVPDPNTSPPQPHPSVHRARHSRSQSGFTSAVGIDLRRGPMHVSTSGPIENGGRSAPVNRGLSPTGGIQSRTISATSPALGLPARQRSIFDIPPSEDPADSSPSSSRTRHHNRRSLPPVPRQPSPARRRQPIPEEDECPVCHNELPSRTLANFEALRESHITNCIMSHSTYGGSPAAVVSPTSVGSTGEGPSSPPGVFRPTVRRTGMFPYVATEKDCVDSAECTICLEEFEVGVMMARLECLCRFHHRCITAWFVGHPGRCPVHQHDSFGF
ncbi:hypothetical protein MCOR27_004942 [Pyricularia oryzae]|uniref:RING-type E3 ubiquitin transferase n=2 Tax=Pyricularia TaxID=48558 RepID=A0ABQ8NKS7_PYRGI|nr:hypothetical protein MCOR01_005803 [Pyricularia oryzae]KAI6298125.1 hypothetical protein MCOR33_005663 [Pyricularia grisea]KAI6261784.1 hypothetical protein MCOR19_001996 [Pyricularia oryzae]KAI6279824.1 hypothetical protein MCOR27_004942 [Pyricularia oryzae]KAI6280621.1 hypothetical protein MCOR26_003692 [Pyricularia oryzae]